MYKGYKDIEKRKAYLKKYCEVHRERRREIERKSDNKPENVERKRIYNKKWREKNKDIVKEKEKIIRKRNKGEYRARDRFKYAVESGKIKRLPCEVCGDVKSHGHHIDYSQPLNVRWLCHKHHKEAHRLS